MEKIFFLYYVDKLKNMYYFEKCYFSFLNSYNIFKYDEVFKNIKYFLIIDKLNWAKQYLSLKNNSELFFICYNNNIYNISFLQFLNVSFNIKMNRKYFLFLLLLRINLIKKLINFIFFCKWHH